MGSKVTVLSTWWPTCKVSPGPAYYGRAYPNVPFARPPVGRDGLRERNVGCSCDRPAGSGAMAQQGAVESEGILIVADRPFDGPTPTSHSPALPLAGTGSGSQRLVNFVWGSGLMDAVEYAPGTGGSGYAGCTLVARPQRPVRPRPTSGRARRAQGERAVLALAAT